MSNARRGEERQPQIRATRREWLGLAVIALPCLLYAMDLTVLHLAIPRISAELRPTSSQLLWSLDIYGFFLAGLLVTMGAVGDRIGRRRLLLIGGFTFGAASVLAAFSANIYTLILARALLGIAGATFAPSTLSLIRYMFVDPEQRTFAIGIWTMSHWLGGAVGPVIGGLLLQHFEWGSIFLIAVPVMILLLATAPIVLPEFKNPQPCPLDVLSAVQSCATVLLVIYGFKHVVTHGWQWPAATAIAAGVVMGVSFVRRQNRLEHPLIDLRLLRTAAFTAPLLVYTLGCFVASGISLLAAQYLQLVLGLSPLKAGLWMLSSTAGLVLGALLTPLMARRIRATILMSSGLWVASLGLLMFANVGQTGGVQLVTVTAALFIFSLARATAFIPAISLLVGNVPVERAGEASSISETGSELGAALGIAVLGSIATAAYRNSLAATAPAGLSSEHTRAALETLGGALATAQELTAQLGTPLLAAARAAFVDGFHVAAIASTATFLALAVAVIWLTRLRSTTAPECTGADVPKFETGETRYLPE